MQLKLYHNPRCSKSRQAKEMLEERGVSFETVLYLNNPLSVGELEKIIKNLSVEPNLLVRTKEDLFKNLNINLEHLNDAIFVANLLSEHPKLMERPLLISPNKSSIGRPIENFFDLI